MTEDPRVARLRAIFDLFRSGAIPAAQLGELIAGKNEPAVDRIKDLEEENRMLREELTKKGPYR